MRANLVEGGDLSAGEGNGPLDSIDQAAAEQDAAFDTEVFEADAPREQPRAAMPSAEVVEPQPPASYQASAEASRPPVTSPLLRQFADIPTSAVQEEGEPPEGEEPPERSAELPSKPSPDASPPESSQADTPTPEAGAEGGDQGPPDASPPDAADNDPDMPEWLKREPPYVRDLEPQQPLDSTDLSEHLYAQYVEAHTQPLEVTESPESYDLHISSASVKFTTGTTEQGDHTVHIEDIRVTDPELRNYRIGSHLAQEVGEELAYQGVTEAEGTVTSVSAARLIFRAFGAENVQYTYTDPTGQEVALPLTPHQALASINREAEADGHTGLHMHVNPREVADMREIEAARSPAVASSGLEQKWRQTYEPFRGEVEGLRTDTQILDPHFHPQFIAQGTGIDHSDERLSTPGMLLYHVHGPAHPTDAIFDPPGFVARVFPEVGSVEAARIPRELEEIRLSVFEKAARMGTPWRHYTDQMVALETLSADEKAWTNRAETPITTRFPGRPLEEIEPLEDLYDIPKALECARGTLVNMAKHDLSLEEGRLKEMLLWDGHRFGFVGLTDLMPGMPDENLREVAKENFGLFIEEVNQVLTQRRAYSLYRQSMEVWVELKLSFDEFWASATP
jgi:hypothetical protein